MTKEQELTEERDIFAMAVQTAFARFAPVATLENLRDIQKSVDVLVRKLDRLETQEAALAADAQAGAETGDDAAANVVRMPA